jgi:DNA-binding SARP family transcriptional activator
MRLPTDTWVDIEAAVSALDVAEGALRQGDLGRALASGTVATIIARRLFLAGEEGEWINVQRTKLQQVLVRGLECLSSAFLSNGEPPQAAHYAGEAIAMEPLREVGYQLLIRAHTKAGNRSEAVQAYQQCRKILGEQLGIDPSPETEALYLQALGAR